MMIRRERFGGRSLLTAYNRSGDATMPKFLRNLAAAVLASGFACNPSCWAQQATSAGLGALHGRDNRRDGRQLNRNKDEHLPCRDISFTGLGIPRVCR